MTRRDRDAYLALRDELLAAVAYRCELCGGDPGRVGRLDPHHRRMRSQGGPDTAENLVVLCRPCHDWFHGPGQARAVELALLVRSWDPIPTEPWKDRTRLPRFPLQPLALRADTQVMQDADIHPTEGTPMSDSRKTEYLILCADGQRRIDQDFRTQADADAYYDRYGCGCGDDRHTIQPLPTDPFAGLPGLAGF